MTSLGVEIIIRMSSLLSLSNDSNESQEFSLIDIERLVDSRDQNWFKSAYIGRYLGIARIITSRSYQKKT